MTGKRFKIPRRSAAALLAAILPLLLIIGCCNCPKGSEVSKDAPRVDAISEDGGARMKKPVIVYKTKADYSNYVPVMLSEDKSLIVSYPSLGDIFYEGRLAVPTKLRDGYLLDNRGITYNSGFLDMTYLEYSELPDTPSPSELNKRLLDRDPFLEIWLCGDRESLKDPVAELNEMIGMGFPGCKRLK